MTVSISYEEGSFIEISTNGGYKTNKTRAIIKREA